jgi:hypothetical protein
MLWKRKARQNSKFSLRKKNKPFLNDYSIQVQDKIDRKKIKEEIKKLSRRQNSE